MDGSVPTTVMTMTDGATDEKEDVGLG